MPFSDPYMRMAHARESMATKYFEEARRQFERMGIAPTADQLSTAGDALMRTAQRERMKLARQSRWSARDHARRDRDWAWATNQALAYAEKVRKATSETDVDALRVALMAVADELASPDGLS